MARMRAVVAERPDGPDGLVVREVPRPEPGPGWALVRVEAFGLNRSEYKTLKGYAGDAVTFPRILGIELVGVVEADPLGTPQPCPGRDGRGTHGGHGPRVLGGMGISILSTSNGLITSRTAAEQGVGGEVVCFVW